MMCWPTCRRGNELTGRNEEEKKHRTGGGLAIGIAIGAGIGMALDSLPIGFAIGISLGVVFESRMRRRT